jgi:hypothetical protein
MHRKEREETMDNEKSLMAYYSRLNDEARETLCDLAAAMALSERYKRFERREG